MYDSREKAILDYESNLIDAREEGREEGESIGMEKGRVRLLLELLDEPILSKDELSGMSMEELAFIMTRLQARLRERNA